MLRYGCVTETPVSVEVLALSEAARRLGVPLRELVQVVYDRGIRYVMVDGIPQVPEDALEEFRLRAS